jgi:hypothetical protein
MHSAVGLSHEMMVNGNQKLHCSAEIILIRNKSTQTVSAR